MKRAREPDQQSGLAALPAESGAGSVTAPPLFNPRVFRSFSEEFEAYYTKRRRIQARRDADLLSDTPFESDKRVNMLIENVRLIVDQQECPMMMEHYDWLNSLVAGSLKQLYKRDRATIVEILWEHNIEQDFDMHLWVCPRRFGKTFSTCIFLAAFAALLSVDPINFVAQTLTHAQLAAMTFRTHLETLYKARGYELVMLREDAEKGFSFLNFDGIVKYGTSLTEKERKALITKDPSACCVINIMTTTTTVSTPHGDAKTPPRGITGTCAATMHTTKSSCNNASFLQC